MSKKFPVLFIDREFCYVWNLCPLPPRGMLDEFEQQNIEQAVLWTLSRSFKPEMIFTEDFIRTVHKRMYCRVWSWAGEFRKTNKNIGVDKWQAPTELKYLPDDADICSFWRKFFSLKK